MREQLNTILPFTMVLFDFIDDNQWHLHLLLLIVFLLQYHNNIRDRHCLLRSAIVQPQESPWRSLYINADETFFLHMTGLSRNAFSILLDYLFDLDDIARRCRHGCLHSLYPDGYLGLLLFYLGSSMNYKHFCIIFGITPSVCSRAINWMLKKTVWALRAHPFARVQFPSREKMREYAALVQL